MKQNTMIGFFHENEEYGCFSNWYPAEFDYAGIHYDNSEQFMMYHKVMMFRKYGLGDQILHTKEPAKCKKIAGQKFPEFDATLWEKTCVTIVKRGVKAKFIQNTGILELLLSTGNAILAECSPYDRKWGIGIDIKDPDHNVIAKWKGKNLLGRILMEVRDELRQEMLLSKKGELKYIDAIDLDPIHEWNMKAGELKRIPQFYNAIHAYGDTLQTFQERDAFYNGFSLYDWEVAMRINMGGGLPPMGFYEMKQDVYDTARRLHRFHMRCLKEFERIDVERGQLRFIDQPGQWMDTTPESVKRRRAEELKKLEEEMTNKPANMQNSIEIRKIGITNLNTDAIVNAANDGLWAGTGVCGAIFKAAGYDKLQAACNRIGHCDTGSAVITPGFDLQAKYIIHAVGPIWHGGNHNEPQELYGAYRRSLELAVENGCHSIGFPLISAGVFGYPKDKAWRKGIQACADFFKKKPDANLKVIFAVLDDNIISLGQDILNEIAGQYKSVRETVKKDKTEEVGKITNPKMQTQERGMGRPSKECDTSAHILTAHEIAEYRRKRKAAKKEEET